MPATGTDDAQEIGVEFDYVVTVCDSAHESCPVFAARTRGLRDDWTPAQLESYLSGLLIGAELAAGVALGAGAWLPSAFTVTAFSGAQPLRWAIMSE